MGITRTLTGFTRLKNSLENSGKRQRERKRYMEGAGKKNCVNAPSVRCLIYIPSLNRGNESRYIF